MSKHERVHEINVSRANAQYICFSEYLVPNSLFVDDCGSCYGSPDRWRREYSVRLFTARGFDQNRLFGGLGVALNAGARIEVGYMNQSINSLSSPDRMHHILSGVLNLTF